jgi:hypothetical protein
MGLIKSNPLEAPLYEGFSRFCGVSGSMGQILSAKRRYIEQREQ